MKKVAFSVLAAALAFGANAEEAQVEAANEVVESCEAFNGFYSGLGISFVNRGVKVETKDSKTRNAGIRANDNGTNFAGSIALGYGKVLNGKTYLGIETGLDAGSNHNFRIDRSEDAKVSGIVPSVALRLGYANAATNSMIYLKAGAAYTKSTFGHDNPKREKLTCSKWSPIVALGAEKVCCKNLKARVEAEYRFGANKTHDIMDPATKKKSHAIKLTTKDAVSLRVMAVYTFGK